MDKYNDIEFWKAVVEREESSTYSNAFSRFFLTWIMFNREYSGRSNNERVRVESFENDWKHTHQLLLGRKSYSAAVNFLLRRDEPAPNRLQELEESYKTAHVKIWNMRHGYDRLEQQGRLEKKEDLKDILGCLYVARCNLFHGDKTFGSDSDRDLLNAGHEILFSLLTFELNENNTENNLLR